MPSDIQHGESEHSNEAERFLSTDMELAPVIRGIESEDRILMWWNYICTEGIEGETKEQVKDRMQYLKERSE